MVTFSSKEVIRHDVDGVIYLIAVPTMLTRASYRRDVSALGAVYHTDAAMLETLREGIEECVADDQRGQMIELLNSFEYEKSQEEKSEDFEDLTYQVEQLEGFVRQNYPRYARMESDRGYWLSIAPIMAFRHFVKGWEKSDIKYQARNGLVDESLLEEIGDAAVSDVGWQCIAMMRPDRKEEKNSKPQPSSQQDPETSTADENPQTVDPAGKSAA